MNFSSLGMTCESKIRKADMSIRTPLKTAVKKSRDSEDLTITGRKKTVPEPQWIQPTKVGASVVMAEIGKAAVRSGKTVFVFAKEVDFASIERRLLSLAETRKPYVYVEPPPWPQGVLHPGWHRCSASGGRLVRADVCPCGIYQSAHVQAVAV